MLTWIKFDGFLHIIICFILLSVASFIVSVQWAVFITISVALLKEIYDYIEKRNTIKQVFHDLICDAIGMLVAILII